MLSDVTYALGRLLIAPLYLLSAFGKLADPARVATQIGGKGLPQPTLLAYGAALLEVVAAIMIVVGFKTRWAALALLLFTAAATYFFHAFWTLSGAEYRMQQIHFLKNLAVMGALLMLAAHGAGRYSLDRR